MRIVVESNLMRESNEVLENWEPAGATTGMVLVLKWLALGGSIVAVACQENKKHGNTRWSMYVGIRWV